MTVIHVEDQRETDPHLVTGPPFDVRSYLFVDYTYGPITAQEEDEGLEWWFPMANGDGRHARVHHATLVMPDGADGITLYLQSPDEESRVLIYKFNPLLLVEHVVDCPFHTPVGSRGIIVFDKPDKDQTFGASYLVERL